jgi:hypothetical protein
MKYSSSLRVKDVNGCGAVEADETFIGGKAKNTHLDKLTRLRMEGHVRAGTDGKAIVMGLLEREGKAKAKVLPNVRAFHVRTNVVESVEKGSTVLQRFSPLLPQPCRRWVHSSFCRSFRAVR